MKNTNTIVQILLGIGLIVLYILHFTSSNESTSKRNVMLSDSTACLETLPVAYINVDSLLQNYEYSKDLNEVLIKKRENAQATLIEKARKLEAEIQEFQRKRETNAFVSEQSFKNQQESIMKKQRDLQELEAKLTDQLAKEQQNLNDQLRDTIYKFLRTYNKDKQFQMILSNTMNDNILLANPTYNITNEVVEELNQAYVKSKNWFNQPVFLSRQKMYSAFFLCIFENIQSFSDFMSVVFFWHHNWFPKETLKPIWKSK